jgi:hypothetical protein
MTLLNGKSMADGDAVRHEQARATIDAHIGEPIRLELRVVSAPDGELPAGSHQVLGFSGDLVGHGTLPVGEMELPVYGVGNDHWFSLPPLPGTIRESMNGLDFQLTDALTMRIGFHDPDAPLASLTYEQALGVVDGHLGERVEVDLSMVGPGERSVGSVVRFEGDLDRAGSPQPGAYLVGNQLVHLPPQLPGMVRERQEEGRGLHWLLANGLLLRISWMGEGSGT